MKRHTSVAGVLVVVLVVSTVSVGVGATTIQSGSDALAIDHNHGLDSDEKLSEYNADGKASTELSQIDGSLAIATEKSELGVEDQLQPFDARNSYVKIDYREDFERTLRIHIPREYQMPYTQSGVESITSDHQAEFRPVRGAEFLEIVVHVDGPGEIVLPIQRDSSLSYRSLDYIDTRLESATGSSFFGSGDEWQYIDNEELATDAAYEIGSDPDNVVVQYDAEKADPSETWLNAPKGESGDVGVYWFTRESGGNESAYIVATNDSGPNVRYKSNGGSKDRFLGGVRDAVKNIERLDGLIDDLTGDEGGDE